MRRQHQLASLSDGSKTILLTLLVFTFVSLPAQSSIETTDTTVEWMQRHTDGVVGVYLQRSQGPILGAYNHTFSFEPASAIKVLHLLHTLRAVDAGQASLHDPLTLFEERSGSCPLDMPPVRLEPVRQTLRLMMERSSNRRTHAIQKRFGEAALNQTAQAIGMTSTIVRHRIGCGGSAVSNPNRTSLVDLARLYDGAINGTLLSHRQRSVFQDMMIQSTSFINAAIDREADALGLSTNTVAAFKSAVRGVYKGGSYSISSGRHISRAGWLALPIDSGNAHRNYLYGVFVDGATTLTNGQPQSLTTAEAVRRLLADAIRQALIDF